MIEPFTDGSCAAGDIPLVARPADAAADEAHGNWISELATLTRAPEQVAMLQPPGGGPVELTDKDFDKIGPKAAQVLKDAGVKKLTLTPGADGVNHVKAELDKGLEIDQDPAIDGCRKLKIGKEFECDISKDANGKFVLSNIEGLTAESQILGVFRDATVTRISMERNAKGESEITSTGQWKVFRRDQTRTRPAEVMDKAELLFDRFIKLLGQDKPADS